MRIIKTSTGTEIVLDGDLLAVMEALYREVTARRELELMASLCLFAALAAGPAASASLYPHW